MTTTRWGLRSVLVLVTMALLVSQAQGVIVRLHRTAQIGDVMAHVKAARQIDLTTNATVSSVAQALAGKAEAGGLRGGEGMASFLEVSSRSGGFESLEYAGSVIVGGQSFKVIFDTATAHTWLPSSACATCCRGQPSLAPPQDPDSSTPLFEVFPDGTWLSGISHTATVQLGDTTDPSTPLDSHTHTHTHSDSDPHTETHTTEGGAAVAVAGEGEGDGEVLTVHAFEHFEIFVKGHQTLPVKIARPEGCTDGVLGLSFSTRWNDEASNSPSHTHTHHRLPHRELDAMERSQGVSLSFVDRLFHDHSITEPVFSLSLAPNPDDSLLEFGRVDPDRVNRKLNPKGLFYVSAVGFPDFHWAFNVPRVCINNQCMRVGNIPARISSAVPYIALPQELYKLFRKPQERVSDPCTIMASLPSLSFTAIGSDADQMSNRYSRTFELCPADYILRAEDGTCDFAIVPSRSPTIVLGTPFLRKFFTVFDIEQKRIGLAQSTDACGSKSGEMFTKAQVQKALQRANGDMTNLLKNLVDVVKEDEGKDPPLLKDGVYLTYHKKFVN